MRTRAWAAVALLTAGLSFSSGAQEPVTARGDADWPMYRRDLAGTGYSPLNQINLTNVANLAPAWTFRISAAEVDHPHPSLPSGPQHAGPSVEPDR